MGNNFGGINSGSDATRAHLALVSGGATSTNATASVAQSSQVDAADRMRAAAQGTTFRSNEAVARSRHEEGVRAVATRYDNFEEALLPMVLASGVSGEAAVAVAEAIKSNPALTAQAERAFQRARINAVS